MNTSRLWLMSVGAILPVAACGGGTDGPPVGPNPAGLTVVAGAGQQGPPAAALPVPVIVLVADATGNPVPSGTKVSWTVVFGGGVVSADTTTTAANGTARVTWTLGPGVGGQELRVAAANGDTLRVHATSTGAFVATAGGNNVPERYSSDLWVAGGYAYTGTWNWYQRTAGVAGLIKVFQLGGGGDPALVDSVVLANVTTVSDLEVSPDSSLLVATAEGNAGQGLYVFSLANRAKPAQQAWIGVNTGLHTGSLAVIGGKLYAFGAKNPANPALMIFDLSSVATGSITVLSTTPIPANYGIHDTFVRDGLCFAFVWNEGVYIYDVGNGIAGGTPAVPVRIGTVKTGGGEVHNGWWFHNPTNGERRYLFVGQEGPGTIGSASSGDIHVVDVSDLTAPVEVAIYSMAGAGVHNFWMDEQSQRLYAAYYNGGVVALDVSGTLSGNLASREIARIRPGGAGQTYVWGVQLYAGSLYTVDMLTGLWQLGLP
jgi:hypothetical protein